MKTSAEMIQVGRPKFCFSSHAEDRDRVTTLQATEGIARGEGLH